MVRELILALALLMTPRALAADPTAAVIASAEDAALKGDYEKARTLSAPLKDREDLPRDQKVRYLLLQARIADAYEDFDAEREWLKKLRLVAPETKLDRYRDPPTMFRAWEEIAASPSAPGAAAAPAVPHHSPAWTAYAPFGIGHFVADEVRIGSVFLGGDLLALYLTLASAFDGSEPNAQGERRRSGAASAGPLLMLGIYGHEVIDSFARRGSPSSGEHIWAKRVAVLLPFGVGQARNGDTTRAAYFAGAQGLAILVAGGAEEPAVRAVGWTAFAAAYAYSVMDAVLRAPKEAPVTGSVRMELWTPRTDGLGAQLVLSW